MLKIFFSLRVQVDNAQRVLHTHSMGYARDVN